MEEEPLKRARKIIERFGGIRPMAAKVGAPVTTVQGWKKRDVIPGNRRDDVLKAANENNVDLSGLIEDKAAIAREDEQVKRIARTYAASPEQGSAPAGTAPQRTAPTQPQQRMPQNGTGRVLEGQQAGRAVFVFLIIIVAFLVAGLATLAPKVKVVTEQADRIQTLESEVRSVKAEQRQLTNIIPQDLTTRLQNLQQEATTASERAQDLALQAGGLAQSMGSSSLEDRLGALETRMGTYLEQRGSLDLAGLWTKFQSMRNSPEQSAQLDAAEQELLSWISRLQSEEVTVEEALPVIREESPVLKQTMDGVSNEDLKAAALLLAMTQMRDSLSRDNQSFSTDLALLRKLVGSENPALLASIDKLAPKSEEGVLTPNGLSKEFRGMAGDIVVSSLSGEDVSVTEKAKAKFTELLSLQKDDEPMTGTATQITVAKAQKKLDEGDVQGAIALLQTLDGPAAQKAQPFIDEAEMTLLAGQLQELLGQSISTKLRLSPGKPLPTVTNAASQGNGARIDASSVIDGLKEAVPLGGTVREDPDSGFKIYKQ
ncbi:MAG: COG4223 family protein [Pseudobdellovibrionaceae bacterium]